LPLFFAPHGKIDTAVELTGIMW